MYAAASGMLVESLKADVVANNLANVQTHGFRRQVASVRSFPELFLYRINDSINPHDPQAPAPVGRLGLGAALDELALSTTPGALTWTQGALDVALDGPGFLVVQTQSGQIAYTRSGKLEVDAEGFLRGPDGAYLLGEEGPILLGMREPVIDEAGRVWVEGEVIAVLQVVEFPQPGALEPLGGRLYLATAGAGEPAPAEATRVRQGYLEQANVNVVREMVDLIAVQRAYEANQRMLVAQDETLGRLIDAARST